MKIDLHIHTKKISSGDGEARNINDPIRFNEIMKESKIGICAITNHNHFDLKQYNKFKCPEESYILLPGIEIDVYIKGDTSERRQLNIIWDPNEITIFVEKMQKIQEVSDINPLKFEEAIKIFDFKNTIFFLDHKRHKNGVWFKEEEIAYYSDKINNASIVFDSNNWKTLYVLNKKGYKSFIASDNKDWDNYVKKAEKLMEININFKNYQDFFNLMSYSLDSYKRMVESPQKSHSQEYEICDGNDEKYKIGKIDLFTGVNILFGAKATGKTKILNTIYEKNKERAEQYISSDKDKYITKMKENYLSDNKLDSEKKTLEQTWEEIANESYDENVIKLNKGFFDSFENISSYKIQQCIITPLKINEEQKKSLIDNIEYLKNILKDNYNKKYFDSNKDKLKVLKKMYFDYKYELFKINNKEKLYNLKQKFIKSVQDIVKGWTGQNSIPTDIGLYSLYKTRLNFKNKLSRLKEKTYTKKINLKEYKMPVRGVIKIIKKQKSLPFDESWKYSTNEKKLFNNLKKSTFDNFLKLINFNLHESPKELFQSVVEEVKTNMLVSNKIIFEDHDEKQIELSNGEKAFFTLMWKLEKENKEIFLLDEPGTFLDAKLIANELKDKLLELKAKQKTIVITTHLASLGINLLPMTFIYRRFNNRGEYDTYTASLLDEKFIHNKTNKTIDFRETIISNFEGGKEQFIFRKDIYGIENEYK